MKKILLLTILLFTYGCVQQPPAVRAPLPENNFLIIAHRGASAYTTAHTLAAYEMAIQMGADYIEIDLHMTKDGKLVALHDSSVILNDVQQAVADVTFDEIQLHSPGQELSKNPLSYAFPNFEDLRVVELSEILDRFGDTVNYYIEIKSPELYPRIEEELLLQLGERHLLNRDDLIPKVIIQSFDADSLKEIHAMDPSIPLTQLYKFSKKAKLSKKALKELSKYASGVGVNVHAVNLDFIEAMHNKGLLVIPYTVNDEQTMRHLMILGVNGIFTDRPDVANRVKKENGSPVY